MVGQLHGVGQISCAVPLTVTRRPIRKAARRLSRRAQQESREGIRKAAEGAESLARGRSRCSRTERKSRRWAVGEVLESIGANPPDIEAEVDIVPVLHPVPAVRQVEVVVDVQTRQVGRRAKWQHAVNAELRYAARNGKAGEGSQTRIRKSKTARRQAADRAAQPVRVSGVIQPQIRDCGG